MVHLMKVMTSPVTDLFHKLDHCTNGYSPLSKRINKYLKEGNTTISQTLNEVEFGNTPKT